MDKAPTKNSQWHVVSRDKIEWRGKMVYVGRYINDLVKIFPPMSHMVKNEDGTKNLVQMDHRKILISNYCATGLPGVKAYIELMRKCITEQPQPTENAV